MSWQVCSGSLRPARLGATACLVALLALGAAGARAGPAEILARAIRLPTISYQDPGQVDAAAFGRFHDLLERSFPRVHASLERRVLGGYSLLYRWEGREPEERPILLTSHFDVVPPGDLTAWSEPPFDGVIRDGFVWGRGALDDKSGVVGTLAAVERLLASGFQPRRTVWLAFGHDEEVGGDAGAGAIAAWLGEHGVRLVFSLDEGMAIAEGAIPGVATPVALVGVAEKGYMTVTLTAHAPGGHSSTPPRTTAIGRLARAIVRLEAHPLPARLAGLAGSLLDALEPHMPLLPRLAIRGRALLGSFVVARLSESPASDAMIRTTTAVTLVSGGVKENVLPSEASATVNFRLAPGDRSADVLEHVRTVVDDPEVSIEVGRAREPSPVADVDSPAYALLARTLAQLAPDAVVVPALVLGGTDSKHYGPLAENSFRFTPFRLGPGDLSRVHGVDERVSVESFERDVVGFYELLLRGADELPADD